MNDDCTLCESRTETQDVVIHAPDCARVLEPAVVVATLANLNPRATDVDGRTVCRLCGMPETTARRLANPMMHEFSYLWRRARALYPDGVLANA